MKKIMSAYYKFINSAKKYEKKFINSTKEYEKKFINSTKEYEKIFGLFILFCIFYGICSFNMSYHSNIIFLAVKMSFLIFSSYLFAKIINIFYRLGHYIWGIFLLLIGYYSVCYRTFQSIIMHCMKHYNGSLLYDMDILLCFIILLVLLSFVLHAYFKRNNQKNNLDISDIYSNFANIFYAFLVNITVLIGIYSLVNNINGNNNMVSASFGLFSPVLFAYGSYLKELFAIRKLIKK
ncbi:hypothetical protein [Apilactobacillus timberlakei]|uniref:hypothetical protein n=1 Tax=Apilactobacillus timberlakei TaxID=2008380 RepID=UPI001129B638|nr:hypothetical protein [Apilactobacillus timberlakei]TPR16758.1 hypothetical protein DYZ95_07190 [Apilactobacillus timberlakei]TPR21521.1 hypothetical protein DY083_05740 [Apilactobacillus timberlakei]